jgi:hypothetical protein
MLGRGCSHIHPGGRPCGATPMKDVPFCFWHSPGNEEEAAEARRLGGLRRRREKTLSGAFDFEGLASVGAIRRILEIATIDALGLENSIARARILISAGLAAAKLLETGDLQARIELLEAASRSGQMDPPAGGLEGGLLGGP